MENAIKIKQFKAASCYSYILSSRGEALVIDPHISLGNVYAGYLNKNGLTLKYIVDTHTHADHFSLAMVMKKQYRAAVLMHEKSVSSVADRRIKDGDEITLGGGKAAFMYTPGHTDDSISVLAGGAVFTGDVLLIGSVGRTDFQNGSPEAMFDTLQKIKKLPGGTVVYPGHDYHEKSSSDVLAEKSSNPFLQVTDREAFAKNMRSKSIPKPFNIDNIIRVNREGDAALLQMISPSDAAGLVSSQANVKILDVRGAGEYNESHIKGALNIPVDTLSGRLEELGRAGESYIVMCRAGTRSPMAADMLIQSGIHSVKVMDGGMMAWQKAKLPYIKGLGGISLERQVRVIAGSFILAGLILGSFVNRWFFGISAFVSCGLIYAGITDNCMMGILLMKLPYNKNLYKAKVGGGTCAME